MRYPIIALSLSAALIALAASHARGQGFGWSKGFARTGASSDVRALQVFDDGSGPALLIGGAFETIGNAPAKYVATWDGVEFTQLGGGANSSVFSAGLITSGRRQDLVIGGSFTMVGTTAANRIARWNGTSWQSFGTGMDSTVLGILEHNGVLYACGDFLNAGGVFVSRIAAWNGTAWSALAQGMDGAGVRAMAVFDDGNGPALYAAGAFTTGSGQLLNRIAKWNGTSWSPLGVGTNGTIHDLQVFDDGNGPALYACGDFTTAGGVTVNRVARWNGTIWSNVGGGFTGASQPTAFNLVVHDDGTGQGSQLYAFGRFTFADGAPASAGAAKWNGSTWSAIGTQPLQGIDFPAIRIAASFDDGIGPSIFIGGNFNKIGGTHTYSFAKWNGAAWKGVGPYAWLTGGSTDLRTFAVANEGGKEVLYAAGRATIFSSPNSSFESQAIAKWDGSTWTQLGAGLESRVNAITFFDDGTGPALYAGGDISYNRIAKWDGVSWSSVGGGIAGTIETMAVYDDGNGPSLYVGGSISAAGGQPVNNIARWDGTSWTALGGGITQQTGAVVYSLAVFDEDGQGPNQPCLFAGGWFTHAGGQSASRIARWDGKNWSAVAEGVSNTGNPWVRTMLATYGIDGPRLIVGGNFSTAGTVSTDGIAYWDGVAWHAFTGGVTDHEIHAFCEFDDGTGTALYAGGAFTMIDGFAANRIAKWNGTTWTPLANGVTGTSPPIAVLALTRFDAGTGSALYVGGDFITTNGRPSTPLAVWTDAADDAPTINTQPKGVSIPPGREVNLSMSAEGCPPLSYQWRRNGLHLIDDGNYVGATTASLTIQSAQVTDAGDYDCVVTNSVGRTFTSIALVDVVFCAADIAPIGSGDGVVNVMDLLQVINGWGQCPSPPAECDSDVVADGVINVGDLLVVINAWGSCP